MGRRRLLLVLGAVTCFGVGCLFAMLEGFSKRHQRFCDDHICEEAFLQLKLGMTEEGVAGILGLPAGDYTTRPVAQKGMVKAVCDEDSGGPSEMTRYEAAGHPDLGTAWSTGGCSCKAWAADRATISVAFNKQGKAAVLLFRQMAATGEERPFLDRLRHLLPW